MTHYIDGFVLPIPRDNLDDYRRLVEAAADVWREHGALDYREYLGDDMRSEETNSFTDFSGAGEDEVIIFGWVVFESREARDRVNAKVSADARMADLIESFGKGFDAKRMAYGGFQMFVPSEVAEERQT